MSSTGRISTDFLRVAGFPTLDLSVTSTTTWGNTRLRVALALDSTGSMDKDNKIEAMQAAAKKLIDHLSNNAKSPGDVYISLIPFSTHVNAGKTNYGQTWLDWNDWEEINGDCNINTGDVERDADKRAAPGSPIAIPPGTAASPIAMRTTTSKKPRQLSRTRPRCSSPNNSHSVLCNSCR